MRERRRLRSTRWAALPCLIAAALALGLSACGGGSSAMAGQAGTAASAATKPTAGGGSCSSQVGAFLDSMATLRTNLVAGLSYEQYVGELEAIRGAYHRIPTDKVSLGCLKVAGTPGENSLNEYIEASNSWTACVEEAGCEATTIEPTLQTKWRQAAKLLSEAQQGLKRLEKHPNSS